MTQWVKREHSKGEIDRAGKFLIGWWTSTQEIPAEKWAPSFHIVNNWRTCHGLPLNVIQAGLRGRIRRVDNAIVAQRLKRFPSIMNKLVREPDMKLSQMQDLGGCRAILSKVSDVTALYRMYEQPEPRLYGEEGPLKCYDYITNPKEDGYRGIHVVARYHPRLADRTPWNGQRIEIQLRTKLQHAFATAVETVTTFTRQPLKFGAGPAEWKRFFSLMGSALAIREQTPLVNGTPNSEAELIAELRETSKGLRVRQRLHGWANAMQTLRRKDIKNYKLLLLALDTSQNTIKVTGYRDRKEASAAVSEIEKSKRTDLDAVLVWVSSVKQLRAAYPNYYADTREFLDALKTALEPKRVAVDLEHAANAKDQATQ